MNALGSFALGVFATVPLDAGLAFVFATGFCGAFTTFSTFAFETVRLFETGQRRRGLANAAGSLAAALVGVALGAGVGTVLVNVA
ncbi:MAG: CrcB family protein [Halapricum sp.]